MATAIGAYATRAAVESRITGTFTAGEDTLIDSLCDQVNMLIEGTTGRVLAPVTSATYLYDGDGSRRLYLPVAGDGTPTGGLRAITLLEMQLYTTSGYQTVASTQYFLRERAYPAGPYDALYFTDYPSGTYHNFPVGFATCRITATAGPTTIPDDITELATAVAVSAWQLRQTGSGGADPDDGSMNWLSRLLSPRDREILRRYTLVDGLF